jgi:hypothetical protein
MTERILEACLFPRRRTPLDFFKEVHSSLEENKNAPEVRFFPVLKAALLIRRLFKPWKTSKPFSPLRLRRVSNHLFRNHNSVEFLLCKSF